MMRRSGFTLIELLVVIAIIAVLAAILFPVMVSVKETARQISCNSNIRQVGMAFQLYLQSYNDQFICGDPWGKTAWNFVLNKYSGARKPANWNDSSKGNFFVCPSQPTRHYITGNKKALVDYYHLAPQWGLTPTTEPETGKPAYAFWASYSINENILMRWPSLSSWKYPSRSYMLLEGSDMETSPGSGDHWVTNGKLPHSGGMNIVYLDGHVKLLKCSYDTHGSDNPKEWTWMSPVDAQTGPWTASGMPEGGAKS